MGPVERMVRAQCGAASRQCLLVTHSRIELDPSPSRTTDAGALEGGRSTGKLMSHVQSSYSIRSFPADAVVVSQPTRDCVPNPCV